jgi:hypothetical protein
MFGVFTKWVMAVRPSDVQEAPTMNLCRVSFTSVSFLRGYSINDHRSGLILGLET